MSDQALPGNSDETLAVHDSGLPSNTTEQVVGRFDEYWRMAKALSSSGVISQRKPEAALAIILKGHELGIGPMQAFQCIHHFDGKLCIEANLMEAIAIRRYDVTVGIVEWTDKVAKFKFCRPGWEPQTVDFTIEEAKTAGLLGKSNWSKYPKDMLAARCKARGLRLVAPDVFAGSYTRDEVGGFPAGSGNGGSAADSLNAAISSSGESVEIEAEIVEGEGGIEPEAGSGEPNATKSTALALAMSADVNEVTFAELESVYKGDWSAVIDVLDAQKAWKGKGTSPVNEALK